MGRRKDWRALPRATERDDRGELGEMLFAERMRRGWTQAQLAERLGCGVATVRRWESGEVQPRSASHWRAIERLLGVKF